MDNTYLSLTQNQQLLWIGQDLNPESPMYNMIMVYEIKDAISVSHFKLAFQKLVETSDVLRSVFMEKEGIPVQICLSNIKYELDVIDFSSEEHPLETYKTWEKERVKFHFNLSQCLFDCALIKLASNHFMWYINQHHLITDGYSTTILFSRMSQLYEKALSNTMDEVEMFPSYKAFLDHTEIINEQDGGLEAATYWKEKQSIFPTAPELYHKKDTLLSTNSKRILVNLGMERSERINELANAKGIKGWSLDLTLYNIFLTALFAYVYRISGQESFVIGSPTHNRTKKSFRDTLGFFVESFPIYAKIEARETFFSLIKKIQVESNAFLKNARTGASTVEMSRAYNVLYNYINTGNGTCFNNKPVCTSWVHPGHMDPRHHLRFHVHDFDNTGSIKLYFDFNTKIFDTDLQDIAWRHFLKVLDAFIDNPNQAIDTVSIATDGEIAKIESWNNTKVQYPRNETLLTKFEEQVQKSPENTALIFEGEKLSYKDLDEKANQVAHFLISKGVNCNDVIAVSLNRSLDMMVYIYGIIKAGGAYLPIDTETPHKRLAFILKDAGVKLLFYNHDEIYESITHDFHTVSTETLNTNLHQFPITTPSVELSTNDLAYIIYTSGSTGKPKGVKCHHEGICNRLHWMNDDYPISNNDTFIQKTPITFDVSVWELFWPLQEGARLVVEIPNGHKNPEQLVRTIRKHKVTNIHFVPSMLNVFVQTEGIEHCISLTRIFCSGESLSVAVVQKTFEKLDVEVHNLYGPTEASVDVTSWHCKKEELQHGIPIGKPVANTKLYILDPALNRLPIGVIGELYIAGKQVAKGYLNREGLTKERFVKDIFSKNPNTTMYKTGDLARYRQDGAIEFHGRLDNQIKLRGLRIELGEIERQLENINGISQAIVAVDDDANLVAFYVGVQVDEPLIIKGLEERLPEYMVPQIYVHLDGFELLPSGKVDRKKLPRTNLRKDIEKPKTKIPPQNEIEEIVHDVWVDVLKLEVIGVNENFIRIGGNSLSAIAITSRLKSILELDMSITDVFNYPTISSYANNIEQTITTLLNE
ncbi:amino acid adenylation domain-containing protein [Hyunsoonleella flava]|uniref:Amino acid adenylation domain-containing protein n=1 Tax=Hyunsoonleella flava TaxID=2527939 RepID=A0A4Q9FFJ1_9FLAO|nr:non-ribosomal peptide synthetase [Hyunsoonleella flava]TBN04420.1 amino acid adenylation domain-containing protein [Hyunsoonleella flava]